MVLKAGIATTDYDERMKLTNHDRHESGWCDLAQLVLAFPVPFESQRSSSVQLTVVRQNQTGSFGPSPENRANREVTNSFGLGNVNFREENERRWRLDKVQNKEISLQNPSNIITQFVLPWIQKIKSTSQKRVSPTGKKYPDTESLHYKPYQQSGRSTQGSQNWLQ